MIRRPALTQDRRRRLNLDGIAQRRPRPVRLQVVHLAIPFGKTVAVKSVCLVGVSSQARSQRILESSCIFPSPLVWVTPWTSGYCPVNSVGRLGTQASEPV